MTHLAEREENLAGRDVEGRYRIVRKLGSGAAGAVYEAESLPVSLADHGAKRVAIKILRADQADDQAAVARLTHEAFVCAKVRHKTLTRTLDYGHLADGRPWFAMELLRGVPLDQAIREIGAFETESVLAIIADTAAGLEALHKHGLVHRDVKPANMFLSKKGARVRLIDLGISGIYDEARAAKLGIHACELSTCHGTPAYLPPEQALGMPLDPRADVYSLACVAYLLLTGREPLRCRTVEATVRAHLFDTPKAPSSVNPSLPAAVDDVLGRALSKERQLRQSTAKQFATELAAAFASIH